MSISLVVRRAANATSARFAASGWDVFECDGHDTADIEKALAAAAASKRPAMVACKTHIGIGSSAVGTSKAHGASEFMGFCWIDTKKTSLRTNGGVEGPPSFAIF